MGDKKKVFVTRKIDPEAIELMKDSGFDVHVWEDEMPPSRDVLLQQCKDASALLTLVTDKIDDELMSQSPQLKVVANMAVGYDNFDVPSATKRGIAMANTPGVLTKTTADLTWALLMAAGRLVVQGDRDVRAGKWKTWLPLGYLGQDIYDSTLGVLGLGQIGLEVAKRGLGFDMKILYFDTYRRQDMEEKYGFEYSSDVETVLKKADFISVHTPLTEETYHLIGEKEFAMMKPNAILVNAARGPIVDPKALYEALKSNVIAGAGLDVTEPEPILMDDPLLTLDNCVIAPHIGSASVATRNKMAMLSAQNIIAYFQNKPMPTCVNPEVLSS